MIEKIPTMRPLTLDDFQRGVSDGNISYSRGSGGSGGGAALIAFLLQDQQQMTAVETFSRDCPTGRSPDQSRYYERLLPASPPEPGQQYGFEVDLDRCSGCKACVTACHSLNGLDPDETWRDVGLMIGGTETSPVMQHVTAACHHCLEPACMIACPVNAYEKDASTGIVKHLDDQCFGCQYCTLACPYGVPKYHAAKGIVRKCDMCSSRLAEGEAPACVQACPHEAIAIRIVSIQKVLEDSEADHFLPAAPEPSMTLPTTTYKSKRVFPRNMLPADYYSISPEHPHLPLIVMLVLTQLSVGAFTVGCILDANIAADLEATFRPLRATNALVLGLLALAASTCHLGRPLYAFRGVLGWRHSWLSREILFFGLFAGLAVPYAAACWIASASAPLGAAAAEAVAPWLTIAAAAVAATGVIGLICSAMIYVFTQRDLWSFEQTIIRFALTAALLGTATTWLSLLLLQWFVDPDAAARLMIAVGPRLTQMLIVFGVAKLIFDASLLRHLFSRRMTSLKRSALLVTGVLATPAFVRIGFGVLGGIVMPGMLLSHLTDTSNLALNPVIVTAICLTWIGCVIGELLERYLFFAAVSSPRMPGGVRP